jgi:hypothetical protein
MANGNFVVHNGLTVGPLTINATTGDITTTGNITSTNASSIEVVNTLTANTLTAGSSTGNITLTGNLMPAANITYALGSRTQMWKDVFVGPGTLYINGTAVLGASTTGTPTINMTASAAQDITIATNGGGILNLDGGAAGGGYVRFKSGVQFIAGQNITSSDSNAIQFGAPIGVDSLTSHTSNTNLTLTAQGAGKVAVNSDMLITGNLSVTGSTTTINTTNLLVADNIIDLNSTVTSGTPTLDAGIRVLRGDSSAVQLKWSESSKNWQLTTDGATYANIVTTSGGGGSVTFGAVSAGATTLASATVTGNETVGGTLGVTGAATFSSTVSTGALTAASSSVTGNETVGGTLGVTGAVTLPSITKSGTNGSGDIGSTGNRFGTVWATTFSGTSTTANYADLAENYQADKAYAPGTVVMFGGAQEVTAADADTRAVAGVVSTNPAHLMNGGLVGANVVPVALQGRVPCMVIGPVKKGDMLVSAGHGYAKSSANPQMGQVIGKALYDFPGSSKAVIEVVVGRN